MNIKFIATVILRENIQQYILPNVYLDLQYDDPEHSERDC